MKKRVTWFILLIAFLFPLLMTEDSGGEIVKGKKVPRIQVIPDHYYFGKISRRKVNYTTTFRVKNAGRSNLEIYHVSTSCGCTTATINKKTLKPGETAKMVVNFDPTSYHLSEKGKTASLSRSIYIRSNDPKTPEKSVFITAIVTEDK